MTRAVRSFVKLSSARAQRACTRGQHAVAGELGAFVEEMPNDMPFARASFHLSRLHFTTPFLMISAPSERFVL